MNDPYYNRNLEQRISKNADQSEFDAILKGAGIIESGLYDDKVSGALDDFESQSPVVQLNWHAQDLQLDDAAGAIANELHRRSDIMADAYPFTITDTQIQYRGSVSHFYEFCLAICSAHTITEGENVRLPRLFERASAIIIQKYLGDNSSSIHVGSPRDPEVGARFHEAMNLVQQRTEEWIWNPYEPFPEEPRSLGDEGLDFIVWKETPDKRKGKLFVIGQCACGDDWKEKFNDLSLDKLNKWFHPLSYIKPVRAFTTPHHLTDINLINAQIEAGLVFDRARLSIIAEKYAAEQEILAWRPELQEISNRIIS